MTRYVPADDAVDYDATPLDDESDKESDAETEEKLAQAKALALNKMANKAKVQEETRQKIAALVAPAPPVPLTSAPATPTSSKVTSGPLRSMTVLMIY